MRRALPALLLAAAAACGEGGACPMPLEVCGGACVDLRSDPRHCGACGRPCGAGLSCGGGVCGAEGAACAARAGGALVTLEKCGEGVTLWVTNETFVADAEALRRGEPVNGVPVLELRAGTDCDPRWSWHAEGASASFAGPPVGGCDVCPGELEAALAHYVFDVEVWCPSAAGVLAVDRR